MTAVEGQGDDATGLTPTRQSDATTHEAAQTPAIARLGSTAPTPHLQRCHLQPCGDAEHPLEHLVVTFEEDDLTLETVGLLGKGGFGKVFAARSRSGSAYALKVSSKPMKESDWRRLNEEITLMSHFSRHPNIVKLYTAGRDEDRAYVVMECCAGRSLHDVIAQRSLLLDEILWIGWSLVNTVAYIHSKGCIHRDLKPQNLLFDQRGNLKITDFGLSSRISEAHPRKTVAGTAMYMAPEMAEEVYKRMTRAAAERAEDGGTDEAAVAQPSLSYGREVDTWSIGVVLYVLLTRINPYLDAIERKGMRQLDKQHKSLALFDAVAGAAWRWPKDWHGDTQLCHLVERILDPDRVRRATLQEVQEDPVWNRRPLSCPLSLLQKLNLLESCVLAPEVAGKPPLNHLAENILPTGGKRTTEEALQDALAQLEREEWRGRTQLCHEYQETFSVLTQLLTLTRAEAALRLTVVQSEEADRARIRNQRLLLPRPGRRAGSVSLVSGPPETAPSRPAVATPRRSGRRSVSMVAELTGEGAARATLVRASPDQYALVYPGRDVATRWNLRPVVSLPREFTSTIEQEFRCLNGHVMTKLTAMPHGYNGFDCNVCDRGILRITAEAPAFRCYKCDYDICMKCAYSGRFKEVNFVCVTCAKKFTTAAKLHAHSLMCRGPSASPSPRRSSRMSTMIWDEAPRPSLLEVHLPSEGETATRGARASGRRSCRGTYSRTSSGGRVSIGEELLSSPEDLKARLRRPTSSFGAGHKGSGTPSSSDDSLSGRKKAQPRRSPSLRRQRRTAKDTGKAGASPDDESSSSNFFFSMPPQVELPPSRPRPQLRSSAELRDDDDDGNDDDDRGKAALARRNEAGEVIGIAARRRAASVRSSEAKLTGVVTIRTAVADKPLEHFRQARVPRSASAAARASREEEPAKRARTERAAAAPPPPLPSIGSRGENYLPRVPLTRARSVSGMTAHGGPPLPRRGPGASATPRPVAAPAAGSVRSVPVSASSSAAPAARVAVQPRYAVAPPTSAAVARPMPGSSATMTAGGGGAFLALPRDERNKQQFLDDFLSGGWVRFYSFTNEDTVVLYYCLQPGRYGAMFPTEAGVGTAVLDIYSKLVLYVPCMNNESTNRSQPHPHVQTFYDEEARILSLAEAQRYFGGVLKCITAFVDEIARLRSEGLTPAAVHAAYIYHRHTTSVPRDTKFVYVRKVFPDPAGSFTLFRLSNLRSQVVCNAMVDIRWQSDRRHNVGQKYYVHADGTAEPFVVDHTGILSQVEMVLNNNYRK